MLAIRTRCGWFLGIVIGKATALWAIAAVLPFSATAVAQITPDSTLPNNSSININGKTFNITGGTQAGGNLFHSFKDFSVPTGSEALFNNTVDIQNIISRVTGGSISNIDGLIRSLNTANLFLINPNGIIFGPNAQLNIGGSFFASTAQSLNFADGTKFSAIAPQTTPLLTISVPLGLQFGAAPASIRNQSQLQVQPGKSLALVGGNISLDGGLLQAANGRVELTGVAGSATVGLNLNGNDFSLSVPQDVARADVSLGNGAKVDVANTGLGSVAVTARDIDISGGSRISAGIKGAQPAGSSSGDVTLDATGGVRIIQASQLNNVVESGATGNAGNININASKLEVNGGQIRTRTLGKGNAGNIKIKAGEITIDNPAYETKFRDRPNPSDDKPALDASNYSNDVLPSGTGRTGNISLEANGSITLIGRGEQSENKVISTFSTDRGQGGGKVSLIANSSIFLDNAYIASSTFSAINGAGDIFLQGDESVSLANNSSLAAQAFFEGNSGNITLKSSGNVSVQNSLVSTTGIGGRTNQTFVSTQRNAGNINIFGRSVSITDGAELTARSIRNGFNPGNITINATDLVDISGNEPSPKAKGDRSGTYFYTTLTTTSERGSRGAAGDINITTGTLRVSDGASLAAQSQSNFRGGNITVNAKVVELTNGGQLLVTANGNGDAGNISLNVKDRIIINGSNPNYKNDPLKFDRKVVAISPSSGLFASTQSNSNSRRVASAGNIEVFSPKILLNNQGTISAESVSGNGGNITLQLSDLLVLRRGGFISATAGTQQQQGNGGNITINVPNGFLVTVPDENSDIIANAFNGSGGKITINSLGNFGIQQRSREDFDPQMRTNSNQLSPRDSLSNDITAFSQTSPTLDGQVIINTPIVDPSRGLVELPIVVANVAAPIETSCAAFAASGGSQFTITGRGGLPPSPNEPLTTDVIWLDTRLAAIATQQQRSEVPAAKPPSKADAVKIVPATGWVFDGKGNVTLISHTSGANGSGSTPAKCPK